MENERWRVDIVQGEGSGDMGRMKCKSIWTKARETEARGEPRLESHGRRGENVSTLVLETKAVTDGGREVGASTRPSMRISRTLGVVVNMISRYSAGMTFAESAL